ncbi:MAG: NADPH-dependent FMN reductase [Acidobacteriota bacterium]|jgi:FMN reductase
MRQLILSCSLSPKSRSAVMAKVLEVAVQSQGDEVERVDLRELDLPLCDAGACYAHPDVTRIQQAVARADAIAIATPIYNYETGGSTRNMVALVGQQFTDKVIGLVCAAGGQGSYMSVMGLASSLMLDFRCVIVPRFVYATGAAFEDGRLVDEDVTQRLEELAAEMRRFARGLVRGES